MITRAHASRRIRQQRRHQARDVVCSASACTSSPSSRAVALVTGPIETTRGPSGHVRPRAPGRTGQWSRR